MGETDGPILAEDLFKGLIKERKYVKAYDLLLKNSGWKNYGSSSSCE